MDIASLAPIGPADRSRTSLGWGIVGTGVIARHFAEDLARVPGCHLAGVSSRTMERAAQFAGLYGGVAYEGHDALLQDARVDAVYIATPNSSHFSMAWAAIESGKSVLVEKPLVVNVERAERLIGFARERNVFLMEGVWCRFLPAIRFVQQALDRGSIGTVRSVTGELAFQHPYDATDRFFDPLQGGGALLDLGCYLVSLSLMLLGRPDTVSGAWCAAPTGVDRTARLDLDFGGVPATLRCAFDNTGGNLFVIEGTRGALVLPSPFIGARQVLETGPVIGRTIRALGKSPFAARLFSKIARKLPLPGVRRHAFDFPGYGLQFEIEAATRAIQSGETAATLSPPDETLEVLKIIQTIRDLPCS